VIFEGVRGQYPVLDSVAYLNAGSVGPLARVTHEAMSAASEELLRSGRGVRSVFERGAALGDVLRAQIGRVIGVPADNMILTSSTTEGCNIALGAVRLGPGDEVVSTDNEHPGLMAPLVASGASVRIAEVLGRPADRALDAILARVSSRTRLIALSHVGWMNGHVLPVAEVKERTGLPVLVDGAQSAGAIPVDAGPLDFYTVSCQKWLCGPESTGALYIRDPERWRPRLAGFWAEHTTGVQRFQLTHPSIATLAGLRAALTVHPEWRYRRAAEMTAFAREILGRRFDVVTEAGQATLVSFVAPGDPDECVARAERAGVAVRSVPGTPWVRVSCGYWTNEEDLERLVAVLA
jgi:L-cysteine/cystine lyase